MFKSINSAVNGKAGRTATETATTEVVNYLIDMIDPETNTTLDEDIEQNPDKYEDAESGLEEFIRTGIQSAIEVFSGMAMADEDKALEETWNYVIDHFVVAYVEGKYLEVMDEMYEDVAEAF